MIKHYVVIDMRSKKAQDYQQAGNFPLAIDLSTRGVFVFDTVPKGVRVWKSVEEMNLVDVQIAFSAYDVSEE